jgi:hypothetical protein
MKRPIGYRQITDQPLITRRATSQLESICNGNGEPTGDLRRHSGACTMNARKIPAGQTMIVATWKRKPMITVHCQTCAARYQIFNEADTPKKPQPQPPQALPPCTIEKKDVTDGTREVRREVPQEAPTGPPENSARALSSITGQKKESTP